jgi:DNA-binding transcriptional ArsR family regulator
MSLAAVSKHIKVLEHAGLISRGKEAQWRPCQLEAGPMRDVAGWIEQYRRFWEQNLNSLEDYLKKLQTPDPKGSKH